VKRTFSGGKRILFARSREKPPPQWGLLEDGLDASVAKPKSVAVAKLIELEKLLYALVAVSATDSANGALGYADSFVGVVVVESLHLGSEYQKVAQVAA
jgi:hypothetical protein